MTTIYRHFLRACVPLVVASVAGCGGSTSVHPTHPLIAAGGAVERTKVYFIRPDPGFRGVMDMPVTISLGGAELLTLAKGQYTLIPLASGSAEMKVESYTVAGPSNRMTPVSTTTQLTFSPRGTQYLVFELVPRGWLAGSVFLPHQVSRDRALDTVRGLTPVGMAIDEPISKFAAAAEQVVDGVYFSPLGNFTVPVPNWRNLRIQDRSDSGFAIVSFLDRSDLFPAPMWSIASLHVTPDVESIFDDPQKKDAAYRSFLTGFAMPHLFQNVAPRTTIVHEDFLEEGGTRYYFAVVNIPEAHTFLHNPKKEKQDDSVSGLLIFYNKGFMYMVRNEMKTAVNPNLDPSSLGSKDLEAVRKNLLRIKGTMKFAN